MDDLPELPFEKVLSYLSLEDRLKARAVSRRWCEMINRFRAKSLCFSDRSSGLIFEKGRWVSGAFAQNFINSTRFSFFNTFGSTILSNMKHLRLCDLNFDAKDEDASPFVPALNMFGQLEELDIIRITWPSAASDLEIELNLPMLTSIHLQEVKGIDQLTLDAPKLKKVKLLKCSPSLRLELVRADSVEWLATRRLAHLAVKNLKSLKYLHCGDSSEIDSTFLSGLEQLKEIHLQDNDRVSELFEQKQRYGRANLKIFLLGLLLNRPDDPTIASFIDFNSIFIHLAKNLSRLADEIPIFTILPYTVFTQHSLGRIAPELAINVLRKFTDLNTIQVTWRIPVQDVQRFLDLLKNLPNIVFLSFSGNQPQNLFDRLSKHCAIQYLFIHCPVSDFRFLCSLEHLIILQCRNQINTEMIRKAFKELQFLSVLNFQYLSESFSIIRLSSNYWEVSVNEKHTPVADLNAAIQLIFGQTPPK